MLLTGMLALALACKSGPNGEQGGTTVTPTANTPSPATTKPPPPTSDKARSRLKRKPLPKIARKILTRDMQEHGEAMESLLWAALMLDYESVQLLATSLANAPRIAKPSQGDQTLNEVFPQRYFELQEQKFRLVVALSAAAKAKDDTAIANQYAELAKTCVNCHSVFLQR